MHATIEPMKLRVLYWNIWLENQMHGPKKAQRLIDELEELVTKHNPDIIGINEAMRHVNHTEPYILTILKAHGYDYVHFAPASPYTKDWIIGAAIASKIPLSNLEDFELGYDTRAERRGFPGEIIKAISCSITLNNQNIHIIVSHLICLRTHTLKDHYAQARRLKEHIGKLHSKNVILGGDFNEPRGMPRSFLSITKSMLHHRTGSLRRPTWSHNGYNLTPIRANLDRLFWSKGGNLSLQSFHVIPIKSSDHLPLVAEFEIRLDNERDLQLEQTNVVKVGLDT